MSETVYIAGLGLSEGGKFSIDVFTDINEARDYVEEFFEDSALDREWSTEPIIEQEPGESLSVSGEALYYGFEKRKKGFIEERELEISPEEKVVERLEERIEDLGEKKRKVPGKSQQRILELKRDELSSFLRWFKKEVV